MAGRGELQFFYLCSTLKARGPREPQRPRITFLVLLFWSQTKQRVPASSARTRVPQEHLIQTRSSVGAKQARRDVGVPQLIGNGRSHGPTKAGASPRCTSLQDAVLKRSPFPPLCCEKPPRNENCLQKRVATLQTRDSSVLPTAAIPIPGIWDDRPADEVIGNSAVGHQTALGPACQRKVPVSGLFGSRRHSSITVGIFNRQRYHALVALQDKINPAVANAKGQSARQAPHQSVEPRSTKPAKVMHWSM